MVLVPIYWSAVSTDVPVHHATSHQFDCLFRTLHFGFECAYIELYDENFLCQPMCILGQLWNFRLIKLFGLKLYNTVQGNVVNLLVKHCVFVSFFQIFFDTKIEQKSLSLCEPWQWVEDSVHWDEMRWSNTLYGGLFTFMGFIILCLAAWGTKHETLQPTLILKIFCKNFWKIDKSCRFVFW